LHTVGPRIRLATRDDVAQAAELLTRMKRFNAEFDPLLNVARDVGHQASKYITDSVGAKNTLLLVATSGERVVGVLRAELRRRPFYEPSKEGHVTDLYILPEARRRALGRQMLEEAKKRLASKGAQIMTAEFPASNHFAVAFYHKNGFRALTNLYARETR
jgi:ribosomal protein S18 acetylase RimI-like enzyme